MSMNNIKAFNEKIEKKAEEWKYNFQVQRREFSEESARVRKVNLISLICMTIIEMLLVFAFTAQLTMTSEGKGAVVFLPILVLVAGLIFNWISYIKDKASERLRYIMLVSFLLAYAWLNLSGGSVYVMLYIIPPLFCYILYCDKKCSRVLSTTSIAIVVLRFVITLIGGGGNDSLTIVIVAMVLFALVYFQLVTSIYKRFDYDTVQTMRDEQKLQQTMLEDILEIIESTQTQVRDVAGLMETLHDSTDVVNQSLREITIGTQDTAESIQEQTVMTESIRSAVQKADEGAVSMAQDSINSAKALEENTARMQTMQQQSEIIEAASADVVEAMNRLKEKVEAVSGITQVIFQISNQTNLLALNASIESARAGEAGRGFSVVADQIRQLAVQTKQSTEQIAQIAQQLNEDADTASNLVAKSVDATNEQKELIVQNVVATEEISRHAVESSKKAQNLTEEINKLLVANNKIVESIAQLSAVSEEVTASTQQASELSDNNAKDLYEASKKVVEVKETVLKLNKYQGMLKTAEEQVEKK